MGRAGRLGAGACARDRRSDPRVTAAGPFELAILALVALSVMPMVIVPVPSMIDPVQSTVVLRENVAIETPLEL